MMSLSLCLLYAGEACGQVTAFDHRDECREWFRANYPRPDSIDDSRLLKEACMAIAYEFDQDEPIRLLAAVGERIPAVNDYLQHFLNLEPDTLMRHRRHALNAIANYADSIIPGSYAARFIRLQALADNHNYANHDNPDGCQQLKDIEALMANQQKIADSSSDPKEKELLLLSSLCFFLHRNIHEGADNPKYYPELFELERLALKTFPLDSQDASLNRISCYSLLGNAIASISYHDEIGLAVKPEENPYVNGTYADFPHIGDNVYANMVRYAAEAEETARCMYGDWHPVTLEMRASHVTARQLIGLFPADEHNDLLRYATLTMQPYSPVALLLNHQSIISRVQHPDAKLLNTLTATAELEKCILGPENGNYLHLWLMSIPLRLQSGYDAFQLSLDIDSVCREAYPSNAIKRNILLTQLFPSFDFFTKSNLMQDVYDHYIHNHNGSVASLRLGKNLLNYYLNSIPNDSLYRGGARKYADDCRSFYGPESPHYFNALIDSWTNPFSMQLDQGFNVKADSLLAVMKPLQFNRKYNLTHKLRQGKALCYLNAGDSINAIATFRNLVNDYPDVLINKGLLANMLLLCDINNPEARRLAVEFVDSAYLHPEQLDYNSCLMPVNLAMMMSDSLRSRRHIDMLLAREEKNVNYITGLHSNLYYTLRTYLINLLNSTGGFAEAASVKNHDKEEFAALMRYPNFQAPQGLMNYIQTLASAEGNMDDKSVYVYTYCSFLANLITANSTEPILLKRYILTSLVLRFEAAIGWCNASVSQRNFLRSQGKDTEADQMQSRLDTQLADLKTLFDQVKATEIGLLDSPDDMKAFNNFIPTIHLCMMSYGSVMLLCSDNEDSHEFLDLMTEYAGKILADNTNPAFRSGAILATILAYSWDDDGLSFDYDTETMEKLRPLFAEAENIQIPEHLPTSVKLSLLGFRYQAFIMQGRDKEAVDVGREAYRTWRSMVDGNYALMTEAEQNAMDASSGSYANIPAQMLELFPDKLAGETYDAVVHRTGLQLRSQQQTRRLIEQSNDPELIAMVDSLQALRRQISLMEADNLQSFMNPESRTMQRFIADRLEQQVMDRTAKLRAQANPVITWQMIRDRLAPGQAAVEFVFSSSQLMALVLRHNSKAPEAITLCDHKQLTDALRSLNATNAAALVSRLFASDKIDLYSMLWQPMENVLKDADRVYFSAPGILYTIPFNAITTPDGSLLMDRYDLRQLTSTARIAEGIDEYDGPLPDDIAMVSDIVYSKRQVNRKGLRPGPALMARMQQLREEEMASLLADRGVDPVALSEENDTAASRYIVTDSFGYLYYTAFEGDTIANECPGSVIRRLQRTDASEKQVRQLCRETPKVLHLATHGFYIPADKTEKFPYFKGSGRAGVPMERSGVVLAYGEHAWQAADSTLSAAENGILSAAEISSMNLHGTSLVALSACESALGDFNLEGVFGLTRGFKQAGARSLLVSLWKVNDLPTAIFMATFYHEWRTSRSKYTAYRNALRQTRHLYPAIIFWAPFILLD